MKHVPPVFGEKTLGAVANASRSVKLMLESLEIEARPIAYMHTHYLMPARHLSRRASS